jgi:hypothetical protein
VQLTRERERTSETSASSATHSTALAALRDELNARERECHALQLRLIATERDAAAAAAATLAARDRTIAVLEADKKKGRDFLESAKKVIKELNEKIATGSGSGSNNGSNSGSNSGGDTAVESLRRQLQERDQEVAFFKKMRAETKEITKREEELVVSAFYELGVEVTQLRQRLATRQGAPQGAGGARANNSFLSQARAGIP